MRLGIHPQYHKVLYVDPAAGVEWVGYSTRSAKETKEVDGVELPVVRLEISSHSHPFWTGKARTLDAEGRIDRFKRRYARQDGGGQGSGKKGKKAKDKADQAPPADKA
ncbi:MAG: type B 50S ribosomal protein L31 [Myxococcales bacterium FL481]|nr:MAG: type B 50S ribosomal protein L31 [Myxococcales bacterium FL481]